MIAARSHGCYRIPLFGCQSNQDENKMKNGNNLFIRGRVTTNTVHTINAYILNQSTGVLNHRK